jgi:hypothetical protein
VESWPDPVDEVIAGDLTVAAAYVTPAGGAVVTGVAPCGLRDRAAGTIGFTTSLGFPKKLERIVRDPRVALAYHTREHTGSTSRLVVLAQGRATVDLTPSPTRLDAFGPQAVAALGEVQEGRGWDWLLREYYRERVFVDIEVSRIVAWDRDAREAPEAFALAFPQPPPPQDRPRNGTAPRVDVGRTARAVARLPHRVLAYRGTDGFPIVVPIEVTGHGAEGLRLAAAPGLLPPGGRRAGLLAHAFRPRLVGLETRTHTGWLDVAADGSAVYAPHTTSGFRAPPRKHLLLVTNGLLAKYGMWRARRADVVGRLRALAAERARRAEQEREDVGGRSPDCAP